MKILVLNSGSSSQKARLYEIGDPLPARPPRPLWDAKIEWNGDAAEIEVTDNKKAVLKKNLKLNSRQEALEQLLSTLWKHGNGAIAQPSDINAVGHRIVHGGPHLYEPIPITPEIKKDIAAVSSFAPLHNLAELEGIELIEKVLGHVPQVAVFDTGFHRNLPLAASVYPGPYEWLARGIRRYGFHGINHQYCASRAAELLGRDLHSLKIVSCHLGNGCSLAAIDGGRSVDTTMGFTPLEGLMMGTRSGSIDPAILIYLIRQDKITADDLERILNQESGLLGISGLSSDMRAILKEMDRGNHQRAKLAFDMFVHNLQRGIGAMAAVLGGLDVLIFTAGIGENSVEVRAAACAKLHSFGVEIDPAKNSASPVDTDVSTSESRVKILVIAAEEDWAIARSCWSLLRTYR